MELYKKMIELRKSYSGGTYEGGKKVVEYKASRNVTWLNESGVTTARSGQGGRPVKGRFHVIK